MRKRIAKVFHLIPYFPLSTNVERGTGGEVFKLPTSLSPSASLSYQKLQQLKWSGL
jgi:hypothetical protein